MRTTLGVILGLLLRAGLTVLLALVAPSPLGEAGLPGQLLLYYACLWPAALVQILAVSAFLWLIRDLLIIAPPPSEEFTLPTLAPGPGGRQSQLLEALLEPADAHAVPPLPMGVGEGELAPPPRRSPFRRPRRPAAPPPQAPLPDAEPPPPTAPPVPDTALALPTQPAPDETAALPLVGPPPGPPPGAAPAPPTLPGAEE